MNKELMLPPGYTLRLAGEGDNDFLFELFCSARAELTLLPLPKAQLDQLLGQQYDWQQKGYTNQYPGVENWVIETQAGAVGKIMLHRCATVTHIIDFIIAPNRRNQGIGSTILDALKKYVGRNSAVLRLSVDRQNFHAKRLYLRHGFVVSQSSDTHEQLVWSVNNQ